MVEEARAAEEVQAADYKQKEREVAEWEWYQTATDKELDERQRAREATIARRGLEVAEEQRLDVAEEQQRFNQRW